MTADRPDRIYNEILSEAKLAALFFTLLPFYDAQYNGGTTTLSACVGTLSDACALIIGIIRYYYVHYFVHDGLVYVERALDSSNQIGTYSSTT